MAKVFKTNKLIVPYERGKCFALLQKYGYKRLTVHPQTWESSTVERFVFCANELHLVVDFIIKNGNFRKIKRIYEAN